MVIFLQGCPLRCLYCHNPDTWDVQAGQWLSLDTLLHDIRDLKPYLQNSGGGVTLSGGEPLMQAAFARELFVRCRLEGIHTAVDTSGVTGMTHAVEALLEQTDLVLLDVKHGEPERYQALTGQKLDNTLAFLEGVMQRDIAVTLRHVVVPGWTNATDDMAALVRTLQPYADRLQGIQLLPYHTLGKDKWERLGKAYPLEGVPPATAEDCVPVQAALQQAFPQLRVTIL